MLVGPGWAPRSRDLRRIPFFASGLSLGVAFAMVGVAVLSAPIPPLVCVAVFAVVNVVALVDVGLNGALPHVPRRARMIPEARFYRALARGAFPFGVELGTGLMALALYASVYALLLTPLATRDFFVAAPAVLGWAVGRSMPLVSRGAARQRARASVGKLLAGRRSGANRTDGGVGRRSYRRRLGGRRADRVVSHVVQTPPSRV